MKIDELIGKKFAAKDPLDNPALLTRDITIYTLVNHHTISWLRENRYYHTDDTNTVDEIKTNFQTTEWVFIPNEKQLEFLRYMMMNPVISLQIANMIDNIYNRRLSYYTLEEREFLNRLRNEYS